MQHRIRKQVMDLTISSGLDAFRTQHLASPFYYRRLLPALERIFNELCDEKETLSLDKLELDLGIIPVQELQGTTWNASWEPLLREQVSVALREQRKDNNVQLASSGQNICRQWLFYMQNGYLPWNANGFDEKAIPAVLEILATDYQMMFALRQLVQKSTHAQIRIVQSNNDNFLVGLVEVLTVTRQAELLMAINELEILFQSLQTVTIPAKQLRQQLWVKIIQIVAREKRGMQTGILVKTLLMAEKELPLITQDKLKELAALKTIYPVLKVVQLKQTIINKQKQYDKEIEKEPGQSIPQQESIQYDEIDGNGIFLSHAGLVLLHPFLSTFFKKLELVSEGKLVEAEKAIHLLHYLATGKTASEEHELAIPKLLCAIPLHHALKQNIELSEEEMNEANSMLEALIEKWEKLKNVSIDALRENFLQRSGKLYTKNDMRYLQVENGALDVLLDYLPWTLSIVKLPWMKELLRIEWR